MTKTQKNIAFCTKIYEKYEHLMLERFTRPIENLDVKPRFQKVLRANGITHIGILAMLRTHVVMDFKGIGWKGYSDIEEAFRGYGVNEASPPSRLIAPKEEDIQLIVQDILGKSSTAKMREFNSRQMNEWRWTGIHYLR